VSTGTSNFDNITTSSMNQSMGDPKENGNTVDEHKHQEQSAIAIPSPQAGINRSQSAAITSSLKTHPNYTNAEVHRTVKALSSFFMSKKFTSAMLHSSNSIDLTAVISSDIFDKAEQVILESLKNDYWKSFQESTYHTKLKNFLWFKDRKVVPDDFLTMRVLGRGGFGLVYGTLLQVNWDGLFSFVVQFFANETACNLTKIFNFLTAWHMNTDQRI
jgi:hypothetical protein